MKNLNFRAKKPLTMLSHIMLMVLESSADFRLICPAVPSVDGPERIKIDPPSPSVSPNADPATSSKSPPESPSDESDALPDRRMT